MLTAEAKATEIADELLRVICERTRGKDLSIFLCGGAAPRQKALRRELGQALAAKTSRYRYHAYYAEDLFIEVLFSHHKADLLYLENLLADSVHAVAILLESAGTLTELGAFANHEKLRNKLIVIVNPKCRRQKSFVNLGPIRHLQRHNSGAVAYIPISPEHLAEIAEVIRVFTRSVRSVEGLAPSQDLSNPILAYEYYLALIHVFDPLPVRGLQYLARGAREVPPEADLLAVADAVVSTLVRDGLVVRTPSGLSTTPKAITQLFPPLGSQAAVLQRKKKLTELRTAVLNAYYRGKRWKRGGVPEAWSACCKAS